MRLTAKPHTARLSNSGVGKTRRGLPGLQESWAATHGSLESRSSWASQEAIWRPPEAPAYEGRNLSTSCPHEWVCCEQLGMMEDMKCGRVPGRVQSCSNTHVRLIIGTDLSGLAQDCSTGTHCQELQAVSDYKTTTGIDSEEKQGKGYKGAVRDREATNIDFQQAGPLADLFGR